MRRRPPAARGTFSPAATVGPARGAGPAPAAPPRPGPAARRGRRGLSLLEVLVAGAVLAVAAVTLAGAQASALRSARAARLRGAAVGLAERTLALALASPPRAPRCASEAAAPDGPELACRLELEPCRVDAAGLRCGAGGDAWRVRVTVRTPEGDEVVLTGVGVAPAPQGTP